MPSFAGRWRNKDAREWLTGHRRGVSHASVFALALAATAIIGGQVSGELDSVSTLSPAKTYGSASVASRDYGDFNATVSAMAARASSASNAAAATESDGAKPVFVMHQAAEGESLGSIAERYGVSVDYLIWNNPEVGADPNMLLVGEELLVPGAPGIVYDVRLGDTISDIAATYSVNASDIVSFAPNKLDTPDLILEGMVLLLPGGVPPAPPPPPVVEEDTTGPADSAPEESAPVPVTLPPAAVVREAPAVVSAGFIWPVNGTVWGGFGPRWGSFHKGIDIGAGYGTAVGAAAAGQVVLATAGGGYGNYVIVRHADGLETLYAHLSAIYVSLGQYVGQGETLGAVGCTGWCTGNHLHFEVHVGSTPVDPMGYLP